MNGQKERLVKYLANDSTCADFEACEACEYNSSLYCIHEAKADELLDKGVIVPPVKLGETIHIIVNTRPGATPRTVGRYIKTTTLTFANMERVLNDWGKTVFGTYPEAAKAWAEMDKKER